MQTQSLYFLLAAVLVVIGLLGTVLPALPGLPLVFGGMLLAAWVDDFEKISIFTIVVLGLLTLLSVVVDFWASAAGAKRVGASRLAVIGAVVGTIAGLFFGLIGVFVGPFIGALAGELLQRRSVHHGDIGDAAKIGLGTWMGIILGTVLKLALAFMMIGLFALAWFI